MISVIICTYNRSATLKETLASLDAVEVPPGMPWELIVVDNRSPDDTAKVVKSFAAASRINVRYFYEAEQGLSQARNRGIRESQGDLLVFTDDDVTVEKSWLVEIARLFEDADCMAGGGKIVPVWQGPRPDWFSEEGAYSLSGAIVQFDFAPQVTATTLPPYGANMAFRKAAFERYGMFRHDLGRSKDVLMSGEETELFRRLLRAKEKVVYTPHAVVYHPVGADRSEKSYFERWFFQFGRGRVREEGIPTGAVRYFGAPRYLLKDLVEQCVKWIFTFGPTQRFYERVQMYRMAGMVCESRTWQVPPVKQVAGHDAPGTKALNGQGTV